MFDGATSKHCTPRRGQKRPHSTSKFVPHPAYDDPKACGTRFPAAWAAKPPSTGRSSETTRDSQTKTGPHGTNQVLSDSESQTTLVAELLQQIPSTGKVAYAARSKAASGPGSQAPKSKAGIVAQLIQTELAKVDDDGGDDDDPLDRLPLSMAFPPLVAAAPIPPPAKRPARQADIKDRRSC